MADGKVIIDTGLDTSGFEKGINRLPSKLGGVTSALKGVAKATAAAFSIKAIVDFGKAAIEIGSSVSEVQNVVDTAFGSMAYKVEAFASTSIEQFGMSTLSAKKTASTYMAMARGMGLNEEAASDMSIALAGLTGDVASFYNISQELADVKLKSVFTGETETLKDLGVVMTQANLKAYALQNGITKSLESMSQAELVGLRYRYVMDSLSLAQGDFAKTSGSWANQTRILSENWKEFMSIVGQGLIQILTPLVQLLNRIVSGLVSVAKAIRSLWGGKSSISEGEKQTDSLNSAANSADGFAENLDNATAAAKKLKKVTAGFDEMNIISSGEVASGAGGGAGSGSGVGSIDIPPVDIDFGEPDISNIEKAVENIHSLFDGLKNYVTTIFAPSISSWGPAFTGLQVPIQQAFGSISSSLGGLWQNALVPFGGYLLETWIPDIVNSFSTTFAPIFADVMPVIIEEFAKDFDFACQNISRATNDILIPVFEQARIIAIDVFDGIKKAWDEHGVGILQGFQSFRDSLKQLWDTVYNNILKPIFDRVSEMISWLWDKHLKPLWDNIVDFIGSVIEFIMALWNNVLSPIVDFIVTVLGPTVSHVVGTIVDVIGTVVGVISDVIGGILEALGGLLDFLTGVFTGNWEKAWDGIKQFFKGIWDGIWGIFKGVVNLIIDGINLLWGAVYSVVAGIVNGIGKIAGAIGSIFGQDWHFSMPAKPPLIPKLAQGAVIPANQEFLAVLGDQKNGRNLEAPESLLRQIVREESDSGTSGPITLILKIGNHKLGSVVLESLNDLAKQNGSLELALT